MSGNIICDLMIDLHNEDMAEQPKILPGTQFTSIFNLVVLDSNDPDNGDNWTNQYYLIGFIQTRLCHRMTSGCQSVLPVFRRSKGLFTLSHKGKCIQYCMSEEPIGPSVHCLPCSVVLVVE